jgi:hypothetical protein
MATQLQVAQKAALAVAVAAVQRAEDLTVVLVEVGELLVQIPTKGMIAGEEGEESMEGGQEDLVAVGPLPRDIHVPVAMLLRWEAAATGHPGQ